MSPRIDAFAWLGLYNDRYSWKWSMEEKLFYVGSTHEFLIWANGQPDCVNANEYCVALQSRSWSAAQSYCRTYHTDLTSIRSKEEKSNITLTLNGSGVQYVWIGLYRDPWAPWSDNTTSTFTNWMYGQPDNYGSVEYCGNLYLMSGKLNDGNCGSKIYFFCFTGEVQNSTNRKNNR
uniref:C-type lectin domain-containing protein n=1 Tax=Neolamprologus brichardi TaxID=32507 RepID=A0A3Q4GB95_NEOBR